MEEIKNNLKRGPGRPQIYSTEEERKQAKARYRAKFREKNGHPPTGRVRPTYSTEEERKQAITKSKTKYMVNKRWCCDVCNGHNYTLAGKSLK